MLAFDSLIRWKRSPRGAQVPLFGRDASAARSAPDAPAFAEPVAMQAHEAQWLQRVLLSCFDLTVGAHERLPDVGSLPALAAELASRGLVLRSARLRDVRALRRGDVLRLDASATARLCSALGGAGLAVVVDDGLQWLRLRGAGSAEPITSARVTLRGLRGSRMLRAAPAGASAAGDDSSWDSGWSGLR